MRLNQLSDKVAEAESKISKVLDPEIKVTLENIMEDMHRTMLTADVLMRKLQVILDREL